MNEREADQPQRRITSAQGFALRARSPTRCGASSRSTSRRSRDVPAVDIVAHRVLWSLPFLAVLIAVSRGWQKVRAALAPAAGRSASSLVTALLIGANWLLYVYAVTSGHILAASFGYYLNPLANVLLGRFVLHERLNRLQWTAVAHRRRGHFGACRGRAQPAVDQPHPVRHLRALRPAAEDRRRRCGHRPRRRDRRSCSRSQSRGSAGACSAGAAGAWARTQTDTVLLLLAGIVSTTPLLLFTAAAKRLPYSTLGMLQFIAPTLQFLIAVAALRRAVHDRARDRLPRDLDRARALRHRAAARAAAAASARMMLRPQPCSTSSR